MQKLDDVAPNIDAQSKAEKALYELHKKAADVTVRRYADNARELGDFRAMLFGALKS